MASRFHEETLKIVAAQLCQNIGFQGILSSSLDVLVDLLHRYLKDITISTHRYTEHYGRTIPTLDDLGLALQELGVSVKDLEEYVNYVEPVSFPHNIPKLPIPRALNLNFLKPGAREILSRPLHIHEHLPPMYPEKEEENTGNNVDNTSLKDVEDNTDDVQASPQDKRPIEEDTSANKKLKICIEEEGEPVREIDSVMMTTSGYISSAREGKMPEARRPSIPMSLTGGTSGVAKKASSVTKKKATMEKIIRHKKQGGTLSSPSKVKHAKLKPKPKIPLAPPGTGSLAASRSPGSGQAPKLKIPNMNKEKEATPLKKTTPEMEGEQTKKDIKDGKDKKEGKEKTKKQRIEGQKKKKQNHKEYKYHFCESQKERTRIRMRGLSKEEELRRYKERENELIRALQKSSAVTVTPIPPPALRVAEKSPEKSPEGSSKTKRSVFRKLPKGGLKDGGGDSSLDLMIAPAVKEEKLSPPPSPNMQEQFPISSPPTPRTPEIRHPFHRMREDSPLKSPHKIKKKKVPEKIPINKKKSTRGRKRKGSTSAASSSFEQGNLNRSDASEGNRLNTDDIPQASLFALPPFSHGGPSLIPPFGRFPFLPSIFAPDQPPLPDLNPMSHLYMEPSSHERDKGLDNFENDCDRPPTLNEPIMRSSSPVNPHMSIHQEIRTPVTEQSLISPLPKGPLQENTKKPPVKLSKLEREKKREHKREKKEKEKERLRKKKEKKEKEKKEREEKKKEKREERERLKKERKEKKQAAKEGLSKISLKLTSENEEDRQTSPSEPKVTPKLVIKPVLKHSVIEQTTVQVIDKPKKMKSTSPHPPSSPPTRIPLPSPSPVPSRPSSSVSLFISTSKATRQEPRRSPPAIAKFSALVTRPPKCSSSQVKKSSEMPAPPLKTKESGYKISSKKDSSGSIKIESKETAVPPLKIKSNASLSISSSSALIDDKKSFYSKKSEKKEKKKSSPLIITTLSNIDTGGSSSVTPVCSPPPPPPLTPPSQPLPVLPLQLPPPILLPSEIPSSKSSKKPTALLVSSVATPGTQTKTVNKSSGLLTETVGPIGHFVDDKGNEVWICPTCGKQDDGTPMIGCDTCDDWYHWVCVGINVPPSEVENWYCPRCLSQHKQQRGILGVEKRKRGRKRKII